MEDKQVLDPPLEEVRESMPHRKRRTWGRRAILLLGLTAPLALVLTLQGTFGRSKVAPGTFPAARRAAASPDHPVAVVAQEIDELLEWPGTVRSRITAQPAPKLLGRILELRVDVGSAVRTGDVIAVLDDRDVKARLDQAKAAQAAADAAAVQSEAEFVRIRGLFEKEAATRRDLEAAESGARSARARLEASRHAVDEGEVLLTETTVRAPFDGVVTEKWAQSGDTAIPGRPIVVLQDPRRLRLEAHVPESCAGKASLGMEVRVRIDALGRDLTARIEEIAPVADPESRTFLFKAALPADDGLRPGMFGRFIQPCGRKSALLIPAAAVRRVGQLELLQVLKDGEALVRHVRTGKTYGERVEVLSGIREGELVLPRENWR